MEYIRVEWVHSDPNEPILLYTEIDANRFETRKVDLFADGRIGFACDGEATLSLGTDLSPEPLPTVEEIASDPEFRAARIAREEFEEVWSRRIP